MVKERTTAEKQERRTSTRSSRSVAVDCAHQDANQPTDQTAPVVYTSRGISPARVPYSQNK